MKTKLEVIEETAAYYAQDPTRRALDEDKGKCQYITEDGKTCAVGRVMIQPQRFVEENWSVAHILSDFKVDEVLKAEYAIDEEDFWQDLQYFHDASSFWNDEGLTEHGLDYLSTLRHQYRNEFLIL